MKSRVLQIEGWQKIVHITDEPSGLDTLISIHDATIGPGCGGCRVFPYESFELGLEDAKNLSRGMSYKNALGDIPFGGGKAVIFADPRKDKSREMLRAFGRAVESLQGAYYTAADSGITDADMEIIREETKYAAGSSKVSETGEQIGGNPSPMTARGVWVGIKAAALKKFGDASLKGKSVSILGIGAVGMELARLIHEEGGTLVVADVNEKALAEAQERFGVRVVSPEDAAGADVDIFAPCALGGAINLENIDRLQAKIVAGAANNQLKTPGMDAALKARGILYAPDYVINAVGVISIGLEITGTWSKEEMTRRTNKIGDTLAEIFKRAEAEDSPTGAIADKMALEVIAQGKKAA